MFQNNKYKRLVESIVTKKVNKLFNLDEGANGHSKGQGLDTKKIVKILKKNGFVFDHSKGDHDYYKHPDRPKSMFSVTVPYMNRMIWRRLCKEHNINTNLWTKTSLNLKSVRFFVTSPRFKLGTNALEGRCSIQLS